MLKPKKINLLKKKKLNSFFFITISVDILVPRWLYKTSDKLRWDCKGEGGMIWGEDKATATLHCWFRDKEMWSKRGLPPLVLVSCELCQHLPSFVTFLLVMWWQPAGPGSACGQGPVSHSAWCWHHVGSVMRIMGHSEVMEKGNPACFIHCPHWHFSLY